MTLIGRTPICADIITFNGPSPRILTLSVGEIVQALALTSTRQGNVALRIGDSVLKANTYIPIEKGQRLSLEVIKVGDQITLKLQQGQIESDLFISAIRKAMPYQRGMSSLLANLTHIADKGHPLLPPGLKQAAEKIIGQLPHFSNLTGSLALKKAIMASGIFLEARLARQSGAMQSRDLAGDFKASLLVLYNLVSRIVGKERGRHNNQLVKVYYNEYIDIRPGDSLLCSGEIVEPINNTTPNLFDYKKYLKSQNINYILHVSECNKIESNWNINIISYHLDEYIDDNFKFDES